MIADLRRRNKMSNSHGRQKKSPSFQRYKNEGRCRKNKIRRAQKRANKFNCDVIISTPLHGIEIIKPESL